jgi:RNA polymerase sigma-70 factor (ECF subfamily)
LWFEVRTIVLTTLKPDWGRDRLPRQSALDPDRLPGHLDRLYRAAWALSRSPHDAEDLVQETMARVLARPRRLHRRDELPYLLRALRNVHLTSLRSASRRPRCAQLPADASETMRSSSPEPGEALEQRELIEAIGALPRDFREALVAVDVMGLSHREAARLLGAREGTIATRLFRGRKRVAQAFA